MFSPRLSKSLLLLAMLSLILARVTRSAQGESVAPDSGAACAESNRVNSPNATKIVITVSGRTLHATLADNPTAHEFATQLPVRITMSDLFGREKAGPLPRAISVGGPHSNSYAVGDIGYWSPGHDLAIYYRQDGDSIPSPGIINVGCLDSGIEGFSVSGTLEVSIERD